MASLSGAVGNPAGMKGLPCNLAKDVATVKSLLYLIKQSEGGPSGADVAYCSVDDTSGYQPKLNNIILDFQKKRKEKGTRLQGEESAGGRVMPGSKTLEELVRVAGACKSALQDTSPGTGAIIIPSWTPSPAVTRDAPTSEPLQMPTTALDDFAQFMAGKDSGWRLAGSAGFSFGIGAFGGSIGSYTVSSPGGGTTPLLTQTLGVGVGLAPLSIAASGPNTPGGPIRTVVSNGGPLSESSFTGPFVQISGGVTGCVFAGAGVSIIWGGYSHTPIFSQLVKLAKGDFSLFTSALMVGARFISMSWGVQYGTPEAGASVSLGIASSVKGMQEDMDRLDKFGPKF